MEVLMVISNLKKLLKEKNISQKELADKIGLTESAVSRFVKENRIPTGENMLKIANALNVKVEDLYTL